MKSGNKPTTQRIFMKNDQRILLNKGFVYEVESYKCTNSRYNLEDSKYIQSKTYIKDSTERVVKDSITYKRTIRMVGASLPWLIENKFVEVC